MIQILFVCTGNICRSPTAEGVFRHMAREAGLESAFFIDSAGTGAHHAGEGPDPRAVRTARKHGVSLDGIIARGLEAGDFLKFDHIYAMDCGHLREITRRAPKDARAAVSMFIEGTDVPDPWYGGEQDFEHAYALISRGARDILEKLKEGRP